MAAAQSALIGVQKADLYPAFSLTGTFGFAASSWAPFDLTDIFQGRSRTFAFGPSFVWDFLNYGRIENAVRAQDAAFQAALTSYQNTVLVAQQEVENGLVGFRKQQERAKFLSEAVRAARALASTSPSCSTSNGVTDFTTVLTAEQQLLSQQDALAVTAGAIPTNLVAAYRALGRRLADPRGQVVPAAADGRGDGRADQLGQAAGLRGQGAAGAGAAPGRVPRCPSRDP